MKNLNLIAFAASILIASASIAAFHSTTTVVAPLTEINGTHVTDMPTIVVTPVEDSVASL
jgi:hypothetical protein